MADIDAPPRAADPAGAALPRDLDVYGRAWLRGAPLGAVADWLEEERPDRHRLRYLLRHGYVAARPARLAGREVCDLLSLAGEFADPGCAGTRCVFLAKYYAGWLDSANPAGGALGRLMFPGVGGWLWLERGGAAPGAGVPVPAAAALGLEGWPGCAVCGAPATLERATTVHHRKQSFLTGYQFPYCDAGECSRRCGTPQHRRKMLDRVRATRARFSHAFASGALPPAAAAAPRRRPARQPHN